MDSNSENPPPPPPPLSPPSSGARRQSLSDKPDTTKRRVPIHLRVSTSSCHDACKFGGHHNFEEKTREPLRKRREEILAEKVVMGPLKIATSRSSTNEAKPVKMAVPGEKKQQKHSPRLPLSRDKPPSPRLSVLPRDKPPSPRLSVLPRDKPPSPRLGVLPRDRPHSPNLLLGKKSSHILPPPEKVDVLVKEGSISAGNKMSIADKKTSDQFVKPRSISADNKTSRVDKKISDQSMKPRSISADNKILRADKKTSDQLVRPSSPMKVKPLVASGTLGKKNTLSKSPSAGRLSPRFYPGMTAPSKPKEGGMLKFSLPSVSAERDTLIPKPRKGGSVRPSSPLRRLKGTELERDNEDSKETLQVTKTEAESSIALPSLEVPFRAETPQSVSSLEENEEIQTTVSIETVMEESRVMPIETGDIQTMEDNHTNVTSPSPSPSPSPSSHEAEAGLVLEKTDKNHPQEMENSKLPLPDEIQHWPSSSSFHEVDDEEEIQNTVSIETVYTQIMEENHVMPIETGDIQTMEDNHTHVTSPSSHEAEDGSVVEKTDENHPQEMEDSQLLLPDEIQHLSSSSSFDEEEIYSSSSSSSQIMADDPVSDRAKSTETKKAQRKNRLIHSEDKSQLPVKLKFRRGKIIELQPENNVPGRIKLRGVRNKSLESVSSIKTLFSLGRSHSSASSEYSKYRSRRKSGVHLQTGNNSGRSGLRKSVVKSRVGTSGSGVVPRKVVLKHSKVERKNKEQVLLNNVIEETASKLVEKRISKVKALVGAFETVISLQETKTSPNSHARG